MSFFGQLAPPSLVSQTPALSSTILCYNVSFTSLQVLQVILAHNRVDFRAFFVLLQLPHLQRVRLFEVLVCAPIPIIFIAQPTLCCIHTMLPLSKWVLISFMQSFHPKVSIVQSFHLVIKSRLDCSRCFQERNLVNKKLVCITSYTAAVLVWLSTLFA